MLSSNTQNIKSHDLALDDLDTAKSTRSIANYIEKIKSLEVEQLKLYLGIGYFFVSAVVTILLFF
jgi:hypothetical protein